MIGRRAYFAQQEDGAKVLLSSSIGAEGRNFQFACRLVLFNFTGQLRCIGAVHRTFDCIGQTRDVQIYVPYLIKHHR